MANICSNYGQLTFVEDVVSLETRLRVLKNFVSDFDDLSGFDYSEMTADGEMGIRIYPIEFESKWSCPAEQLQAFAIANQVAFNGVSVEQGNGYFAKWNITAVSKQVF